MYQMNVICESCGRVFEIHDKSKQIVKCYSCGVSGKNPFFEKPKKVNPETVFHKINR